MNKCDCNRPATVVVQTPEGMKSLSDVIVYVISTNSVYYVSKCHEITIISCGNVYASNYNAEQNPLSLRGQTCYDFDNNVAYVFDNLGSYRTMSLGGGN